jgi:hypothetical protein
MAGALDVGVGELVHEDDGGTLGHRRVEIELLEGRRAIFDQARRQDGEALEERRRLGAAVCLDDATRTVDASARSARAASSIA